MAVLYTLLVGLAVIAAIVFTALVLLTGKGDAMNGGGSVRTTFKGKASFDDIISRWTLGTGIAFMAIILLVDVVAKGIGAPGGRIAPTTPAPSTNPPVSSPATNAPASNAPDVNSPAANTPATTVPATNTPGTNENAGTIPTNPTGVGTPPIGGSATNAATNSAGR